MRTWKEWTISSHTNARDKPFTGLMAKRNTKYVPIALGNVVNRKDPMSRSDQFLGCQIQARFQQYVALNENFVAQ